MKVVTDHQKSCRAMLRSLVEQVEDGSLVFTFAERSQPAVLGEDGLKRPSNKVTVNFIFQRKGTEGD